MTSKWLLPNRGASAAVAPIAADLSVSPLLARILIRRGFSSAASAKKFLHPELADLHDPELLPGIVKAADRIFHAIRRNEKIMIYGDYDVDGVTASILLKKCIELAGGAADIYIPNRIEEGYGVNIEPLKLFVKSDYSLLLSADCGINACTEARFARENNLDFIITDHHEPGDELPEALAVINPKVAGSGYPFANLAGVGVAFKLAWQIAKRFSPGKMVTDEFREFLVNSLALVGLGTLCDVVPLVDENRTFARFGLQLMQRPALCGLKALIKTAGLGAAPITSYDVAFKLGPRFNAAGRMAHAKLCIELLTEKNYDSALEIAARLELHNRKRQETQNQIAREVRERIKKEFSPEKHKVIVVDGSWHVGVLGIVASRIAEEFSRPAIIISKDGDLAKASGRSLPGINLYEALKKCEKLLVSFGGHSQAAGLTIRASDIPEFRDRLNQVISESSSDEDFVPSIEIDAEAPLSELTTSAVNELDLLEPTGQTNPRPLIAAHGLRLAGIPRRIGREAKHLSFYVTDGARSLRALIFGNPDLIRMIEKAPRTLDVAFEPRINTWKGKNEVELYIKDVKVNEPPA